MKQASHAQRWETVQRVQVKFAAVMLFAMVSASMCMAVEHGGELSGTVRDEHGVPQMGAVIELIGAGRDSVRTAVTGLDGRYVFANLLTGSYRLQARASFLRPVSTRSLRVGTGVEAIVNLTLANIYSVGALLPAERRSPGEADDDWMWTMRSAASRPVLRLAGGPMTPQAEAGAAGRRIIMPLAAETAVTSGTFGAGRVEQAVIADVRSADGTREASGAARFGVVAGNGEAPVDVRTAIRRQSSPWSDTSMAVSFVSDPAIHSVLGGAGWRALRVASAESVALGDTAAFEAGTMVASDPSHPGMPANRPFGRVRVFLPGDWTAEYAVATDRSLQRAADAGVRDGAGAGRSAPRIEHGHHQAAGLSRQTETYRAAFGVYSDTLERTPVLGSGSANQLRGALDTLALLQGALVDGSNGTFRAEGQGYSTEGCRAVIAKQLAPDSWVELRFANGAALEMPMAGSSDGVMPPRVRVGHGVAAGVAARTRVRRTGTAVRASYAWQPERMITPINAFDAASEPAYLGFTLEQALPVSFSPRGTVVRVSAGNVLRQGLREIAGANDSVATLAQELPTLRAGIGFSF